MKATDLRIGNIVCFETGELNERLFNWIKPIEEFTELEWLYNGKIKAIPVPITEEWVLKFGFERFDVSNLFYDTNERSKNDLFPYLSENKFFITKEIYDTFIFSIKGAGSVTEIKYVHQLQNLYFALTGEELTTTPPQP